jgi:hypothetical protein
MSSNPLNLALRFLLEVAGLVGMGYWGWNKGEGISRYLLALGIPIIAAAIWGTFRVPNDPGKAPVRVPGILRLVIEIAYFSFAIFGIYDVGAAQLILLFGAVVVIHYALSYDRLSWLVRQW